ncbi:MAG: endo-1,4-beta-xylanase [Acidobacteriia bacterium]|nr:endo-1,4-beta-xylanase [Terriglobia bacterium]
MFDHCPPQNEMQWQALRPAPESFDFTPADALVTAAEACQQRLRGQSLCWHKSLPKWFQDVATPDTAAQLLTEHIRRVAGRYARRVHSWDVVCEAIEVKDRRPDGLRITPWLHLLGPDYLELAFRTASEADPNALLTYNDYGLELDSPFNARKREAVLNLLRSLRSRRVPLHALSLQAHLIALNMTETPSWKGFHKFLDEVQKLNLQVFVTALDVDDFHLAGIVRSRDSFVAGLYRDFLRNILRHTSIKAVLTCGLSDRDTWLNSERRRQDGLPERPLPFDKDLKPKPAFDAMREELSRM